MPRPSSPRRPCSQPELRQLLAHEQGATVLGMRNAEQAEAMQDGQQQQQQQGGGGGAALNE